MIERKVFIGGWFAWVEAMGHLSPEQKQALLDSPAIYYGSTDYMKRIFDAGATPRRWKYWFLWNCAGTYGKYQKIIILLFKMNFPAV